MGHSTILIHVLPPVDDFNNDSQLDIAVADSDADNVGIFLGYGNGTFMGEVLHLTGTGSAPYHIALGDFDNDQRLDFAVANFGTHCIGILLGKGDGDFVEQITFTTGSSRPRWIAVGHFNNDTHLDIVIVNYGTNSIGVMLGFGNGHFIAQKTFSTGYDSLPNSVAVADFNSDKKLDIAVVNYGTNGIVIFLGDGNGSFILQTTMRTGRNSHPYSIIVTDFNNDTLLDIAVTNAGTDCVGFFIGLGNGTFSKQITLSTGNDSKPQLLVVKDFNNDTLLDIAVANYATNRIGVFFGNKNRTFADQRTFDIGYRTNPYAIAYGDFNRDGQVDIISINNDTNRLNLLFGFISVNFSSKMTYSTGNQSTPFSVAVGDFDRDGRLDIVAATIDYGNVNIFLGFGNGRFLSQNNYSTGNNSGPASVAVSDFNQDCILDIAVANSVSNNVYILLGSGDGTFSNENNYTTGDGSKPISIAVGDFNNDNRSDIAVANKLGKTLGVFLGNGDGTFSNQANYSTGPYSGPTSVAVGDFNNDNRLDIAVTNYDTDKVGIFYGYGNGTFLKQTEYFTQPASGPSWIAVGYLNNDNYLDIAVANGRAYTVSLLFGKGNGSFSSPPMSLTCDNVALYSIAIGDFNNDHYRDIVVTNSDTDTIGVFLGYGNGSFTNQHTYSVSDGSRPFSVAVGHFNSDHLDDIVVANSFADNIEIFLAVAEPNFVPALSISTGSSPLVNGIALGDINNDSTLDIVVANSGYNNMNVFLGSKDGTFPIQLEYLTGASSFPTFVATDYFNNDSWLDIAVVNSGTNNVEIRFGSGNGNFLDSTTYSTGTDSEPRSIAIGDFNNDNKRDIVVANHRTNNVFVFLNSDIGSFRDVNIYPTEDGSNPISVAIADFNNDNQLDIVVANYGYDDISVFLGYGNGSFSDSRTYLNGYNSYASSIAVGDFNQDNLMDIVVANSLDDNVGVFLGRGDGTYWNRTTFPTGNFSKPSSVATGDFNNDGRLDIVVANFNDLSVGVLLGYGNGTFANQTNYFTGDSSTPISVAVGDFDNDGHQDIVVADFNSSIVLVFLGSGDGTFSERSNYTTGDDSDPISVAVGDFNKDSRLDIVVANSAGANIGIFFGYGDGTFSDQTALNLNTIGSAPYSVAVSDLNNDSWLDIAVVDPGTNNIHIFLGFINGTFFSSITHSTGASSQPWSVAIGDFDKNNRRDIVVANFGTNNVGVYLGYANDGFLKATEYSTGLSSQPLNVAVGHFDNDSHLDIVVVNSGTDSVMILLGSGYGTFLSQTNYSTGYNSDPRWVATADFNNDSQLDIAVANAGTNSIGVFLGHGNGNFSGSATFSTGIASIPCSLAVIDVDDDTILDIVVANYGSNNIGFLYGNGNGSFGRARFFTTTFRSRPIAITASVWNKDVFVFAINNGTNDVDVISKSCL